MTDFTSFSPQALTFLSDLRANNTRDWFTANKAIYETEIKVPVQRFGQAMADALRDLTGQPHSHKVYRIHRDVRFSKDKTPYNAHIHLSFAEVDDGPNTPMWFFGLNPDRLALGCGVFAFDKTGLTRFRTLMAGPQGGELIALTSDLGTKSIRVSEPELKRVPAGFDKDHPNGEALRRKGFSAWIDVEDLTFVSEPRLVQRTVSKLVDLLPVHRILSDLL